MTMYPTPVLTYHSANIDGNDYRTNNHVAFSEDLRLLDSLGFRILPLIQVVRALLDNVELGPRAVALTMDDGTDFDYHDLPHPYQGPQRSMMNIMRDFHAEYGPERQPSLHATAFVIVSPTARHEIDRTNMIATRWYNDDWWRPASTSGYMSIANHSWDHNHPDVPRELPRRATGTFNCIDSFELAQLEVRRAHDYIYSIAGPSAEMLFAYPYGEPSDYLIETYFPLGESVTGTVAAFGTEPAHLRHNSNRWNLPRYVCGLHWNSQNDLMHILKGR
jgi:peptidoglycan/xylan/chitin deacetylase (PgdA/CDA1 family)